MSAIGATLSQFWDPNREILLYEYGPVLHDKSSYIDIAVVLGVIHGTQYLWVCRTLGR